MYHLNLKIQIKNIRTFFRVWMCSFSLSVSIGSVTLLPFSVIGSEVFHAYPKNYYLKWLNLSLIDTLWNYVFLLSNLSMFLLLPFSYFFIESQGFSFYLRTQRRRPILARVYETLVVCFLVIIILFGITDLFYSIFLPDLFTMSFSLVCISCLSTPMLYSFVSLIGVFMLLISTPLGLAKMFDIFSALLIQQQQKRKSSITAVATAREDSSILSEPNQQVFFSQIHI